MPPLAAKSKGKVKDGRQSRSRHTTPSSVTSLAISSGMTFSKSAYLETALGSLMVPTNVMYDDILKRHGPADTIPDSNHLETLANDLDTLSQLATTREDTCDGCMRLLSVRRRERVEEEREEEQARRDTEEKEKASLKRVAEDDEIERGKATKIKKKKEKGSVKEDRPLAVSTHVLTKQDGKDANEKRKAAHKLKGSTASGSSSSLSPPSGAPSPPADSTSMQVSNKGASPTPSSSSAASRQPAPAMSVPQFQTFGPNPLTFDDPTIYHIREVADDMTDAEKCEIYQVKSFPHSDLSDLIAGTIPDKDFSNAKPSNQVNANTFAAYLEPYLRPLTDEDMAFLKERGDRVTPFIIPPRGKRHYSEIWAEEDAAMVMDANDFKLPPNQPRGAIDQVDDEVAETDAVSTGPLLARLLSLLRPERQKPLDSTLTNGDAIMNGTVEGDSIVENGEDVQPPATQFPESSTPGWKVPGHKVDYAQVDERIKQELKYIGFLGQDDEIDYDAHYDDEIAQRLRYLQAELKETSILNGARKARLSQIAAEQMAYQEYSTILEDLDTQVQQTHLKRNRTLGKGKKNTKRPGGAGGGSHFVGAGTAKPGIGDQAKALMDRRRRWMETIKPVFSDEVTKVRGENESIFTEDSLAGFIKAEREKWDEEAE